MKRKKPDNAAGGDGNRKARQSSVLAYRRRISLT